MTAVMDDLQRAMRSATRLFLREVPTTWDINNGLCEDWAETVCADFAEAEAVWLDSFDAEANHCAVRCFDRWYDAECLDGEEDWRELPFWKNRNRSREAVLLERTAGPQ